MPNTHVKINQPQVVHEDFEDEVVIVNLDTGNYYSIEGAGADVWRAIVQGAPVDEIANTTARSYEGGTDEIKEGVKKLLDELQSEQLITLREATDGEVTAPITIESNGTEQSREKPRFQLPVLNRFTDMKELLLLDPVHDVDESGWPRPRDGDSPSA